jgi:O-antigen ligase
MLILPYEALAPLARAFSLQVSTLEAGAAVLLGAAALGVASRGPRLRVPFALPVALFLLGFLVSSLLAVGSSFLPLKFTARMAAGVIAFFLAANAFSQSPRLPLLFSCLSLAGALTALVALLEIGSGSFGGLLAPFREHAFEVGGRARAAATFAYPNTAGGFLTLTLAPTLYFFLRERTRAIAAAFAGAITLALLLTYSRGALLGAAASVVALWWLVRSRALLRLGLGLLGLTAFFFAVDPTFRSRAASEDDRGWYEARIEPRRETLELEPGELAKTDVRVSNTGTLTWRSKGEKPFHLSYRWFEASGSSLSPLPLEGERTRLAVSLEPGGTADVQAVVRAPREAGNYVLVWDMVHEHTTWFSDKTGLGVPVSVVVGRTNGESVIPHDLRETVTEKSWRPGRAELWTRALELFRAHPLFGVGPDNFRWRYGPASGRAVWDTRVYANSLYLELLSTVGLLGFGAFVVLMAKTLSGLGKRGTAESATLASALVGFLAHGIFDYLLAFTPIYLAIFTLLGASSAVIQGETSP